MSVSPLDLSEVRCTIITTTEGWCLHHGMIHERRDSKNLTEKERTDPNGQQDVWHVSQTVTNRSGDNASGILPQARVRPRQLQSFGTWAASATPFGREAGRLCPTTRRQTR